MTSVRLALAFALLGATLTASTPLQRKQEEKARAAKAATEQKKQHRENLKAQKEHTKAVKEASKKRR